MKRPLLPRHITSPLSGRQPICLKVAYQLYKLYEESGDVAKRDYYKNMIIRDYPDSDYAMIIQDPSYYLKLGEERNREKTLYRRHSGINGNEHARVMQISNEVIRMPRMQIYCLNFYFSEH